MAASSTPQGYQCEFIELVPEELYCKQCSLVARALVIISCCGESYCRTCIDTVQQDGHPCPSCGEDSFTTLRQVKSQQKIAKLQVNCTMKEKGCGWSGPLEHLQAHLDPDQGDCQYVDVDCPLKCNEKIEKRNIDQHTANKCVKRDHVCPYCSFKATYKIVHDIHWPECTYYPLVCPNRCGVTCERAEMEDHMKMCPLEEVECDFSYAGCKERFRREEWEEHMKDNSMKHLSMVATAAVKDRQEFQRKIEEQEKKLEEQEKKSTAAGKEFQRKIEEQEKKSNKQEKKSKEQEKRLEEQEKRLEEQEKKYKEDLEVLKRKSNKHSETIQFMENYLHIKLYKFTMENFSVEKRKNKISDWKSPPMYTHMGGYKFCIGIDANGYQSGRGNSVNVEVWNMKGEFDDQLKWSFKGKFTIQLINHYPSGENMEATQTMSWNKTDKKFGTDHSFSNGLFIRHAELNRDDVRKTYFLKDNCLNFRITNITLLN